VIVNQDTVLTTADVLEYGRRVVVVVNKTGAELGAQVIFKGKERNVALLKVSGMAQPALGFALGPPEVGRLLTAVGYRTSGDGTVALQAYDGSVSAVDQRSSSGQKFLIHNAAIGKEAFGGALLNNCGELVGMNVAEPRTGFSFMKPKIEDPEGIVHALGLDQLKAVLKQQNVEISVASDECLSTEAQKALEVAKAREEAEKAQEQAEKAQQDAEKAREDAQQQEKQAEEEQKKLQEEAQQKEQELQEQIEQEQEKIKEKEEQAKELEEELEKERLEKEAESAQKAELEQQQIQERKRQQTVLMGIAGAALVVLAIVFYLLKRRKRAVLAAESQAQAAREQAGQASNALNAELARKQHLQNLPSYILEGKTPEGEVIAVKVPGQAIGESDQGVVIGRNPAQSEFIINSEEVSREHFRLMFVSDQLMIEDLDTTNGTKLNGEALTPLQPEVVFPGAVIGIGELQLVLRAV
jgi:hypothetical protein